MKIPNLNALIANAKKLNPSRKDNRPTEAFIVETYWEKENKKASGWCGLVVGVEIKEDQKESLKLNFGDKDNPICYSEMDWKSGKDDDVKYGIRRFFLVDGIYRIKITKNAKDLKPTWMTVACTDGKATELSETQAISIFLEMPEGGNDEE
jgi:hypothetical protein